MLLFTYLDENFNEATGVVAFGTSIYNNNDITITATTDGTTQAQIPAQKSVTQQCIYHTPINRTLKLNFLKVSTLKLSGGGGSPVVNVIGYSYSRVTGGRYAVIDIEVDTSIENNVIVEFPEPINFTGREVVYFEAETDVSNTKVSLRFGGVESDS
jgi:hypothetical protein